MFLKRTAVELNLFFSFLVSNVGNISDNTNTQNISYDVSKLIDFPGFNVPAPHRMRDVSLTVYFQILCIISVFQFSSYLLFLYSHLVSASTTFSDDMISSAFCICARILGINTEIYLT